MARKVVGITCGTESSDFGVRHALSRTYVWALERAGAIPIILPVTSDPEVISGYLEVIDGLLLSGGWDVEPKHYGQEAHPQLGNLDPDRDLTELPLIRLAVEQDMPIFAICRGIQSLNVALGGTLVQDLPSQKPSDIEHVQRKNGIARNIATHYDSFISGSRIASIVGDTTMRVNSFHHQALDVVAPGIVVTGYSEDGIIESAEMPGKRYIVAVQFHPEDTAPHDEKSRKLFEAFVAAL